MAKRIILKSGLRLILHPMQNTKTITLLVLLATGSKYESQNLNGISHLLEHLFFKGTKKRPTTLDIAKELDGVGGAYNAFTGKEVMGFWVKVSAKHFPLAADVLSDMLFNPLFEQKEMEKEKKVVFEEINMIEDDPQRHISDLFEKLLYGDQPAGRLIIGNKQTLTPISRDDIIKQFHRHFTAKNIVISVAGNIDSQTLVPELAKVFDKFRKIEPPVKLPVGEKQDTPQALLHFKETGQTHLCLGVRAFSLSSPNRYIMDVISSVLGGSMSARLSVEVRQKRGLAYYVSTSLGEYTDSGYLVTQAGVDNSRLDEALITILNEYKKIRTKKVPRQELEKVKENIKGRMLLGLETSDAWAAYNGEQEILEQRVLSPEEECAKIDSVSQADILRVAKEIFAPERLNLALIGPFKDKERFEKLLKL